ncbi:hypothetical protein BDV93DRAFT_596828 [Ceratobasidium sp. AG-I]|nr:hypothetical protein BDV93DRAFT_596828 [Ceratobasidium sp. AG-I]
MHTFTRLNSFLVFVLSLSFLACALPAPAASNSQGLTIRHDNGDTLCALLDGLAVNVKAMADAMVAAKTPIEVQTHGLALVGHVTTCARAIAAISVKLDVGAKVEADIATKVSAIISVIVHACLSVSVKFGLVVVLALCAQIDLCLRLLLVNLGICIDGIVVLIAKIVATTCADVLVALKFKLCLSVLAMVGL